MASYRPDIGDGRTQTITVALITVTQFATMSVLFARRKTADPRNIYYRNKKKLGLGLDQGTSVGSIQIHVTLIDASRTLTDNIL